MAEIELTLNGEPVGSQGDVGTALDLIRDVRGLTGAKLLCGIGGCGACAVLVDGVPTETCTLAVAALDGTEVTTIEGLSATGQLTSLQKAMVAHDAVQCGYCTPGLVVAAEAFVSGWRSQHGTNRPDRETVIRALDGHLCRCGAYPGIVDAVRAAAAGEHDTPATMVGRPDAAAKLTGQALFTVDRRLEGMLEGKIVRSTLPRAEIVAVDTSQARAIPGVMAIVDLLGKDRTVRYVGQPIAAVAAVDRSTARAGVEAVHVDYRRLPAAVGMEAARAKDAPGLIGKRMFLNSNYEAALTALTLPRRGNVLGPLGLLSKRRFTAKRRTGAARTANHPLLVEDVWTAASHSHAAPEPHAAVALWNDDALTVYLSTQSVNATAKKLAKRLGVKNVAVKGRYVGGAFGAKQGLPEPAVAAAQLARAASAPVRIVFDPSEELAYGGYRPGAEIELALLGGLDGSLRALESSGYMDSGDSAGQTVVGLMRLSYPGPPMSLNDHDVVSNGAPAKPFQAPGAPIALFALESAVDELADRLGTDPITLRRGWNPRAARQRLYDWVDSQPTWADRQHRDGEDLMRGVGVAFGTWHYGYDPATMVKVSSGPEGLVVETGAQEIGTGTMTTLAIAVAAVFGIDPADVEVRIGDSALVHGPTTSASRTTTSVFPTAQAAAQDLRSQLISAAAVELDLGGAAASPGGLDHKGESLPWLELWPRLGPRSVSAKRPKDHRMGVTPVAVEGVKFGFGVSDSAVIAEVLIDRSNGRVMVSKAIVGISAGVIHAPAQARSQVHGAVARGIGEALFEERVTDPSTGEVTTAGYDHYHILRMSEMPEVEVEFLQEGFGHAAGGGAGIAELSITAVPAAVANAVAAATGWRPRAMPMTPDRVLRGMAR